MKKTSFISILVFSIVFLFAGCSAAEKKKEVLSEETKELLPEKVRSVKVTYEQRNYKTTWNLKTDSMKKWKDWAQSLPYEAKTFKKGKTPADGKMGERYTFDINNGEEAFSYMDTDNCYILQNKNWYLVTEPAEPPVMEKRNKKELILSAEPGEISSSAENYVLKMKLLKGWKCEFILDYVSPYSYEKTYEFRIYPEDAKNGNISILYPKPFLARCGNGYVEDHSGESEMTIAGETAIVERYREINPYWNEINFKGKKKDITIHNNMADQWLGSYSEEVLEMLDTIEIKEIGTRKRFKLKE